MVFPLSTEGVLIGAVSAVVTAVVTWVTFLMKNKTDETTLVLDAWKELVIPMQVEMERLKAKESAQEKALQELVVEVKILRTELEAAEDSYKKERLLLLDRIRGLEKNQNKPPE